MENEEFGKSNNYISNLEISTKSASALEKMLVQYLNKNNKIYCKSLKRKIFFDKLPDAILGRQSSAPQRLKRFFVSLDVLKHEKEYKAEIINGYKCFEIIGFDKNLSKVRIHIREEVAGGKDKKLYYISCF